MTLTGDPPEMGPLTSSLRAACEAAAVLHIHRSERADGLVSALGDLLSDTPSDPFASEVVAVPSRGMERWLSQRLSARLGASNDGADGVCANVLFPSPWRLASDAIAAGSGFEPDVDPWRPERAVWPLLEVVDEQLGAAWLELLTAHLRGSDDKPAPAARRFATVRHLAELFDRYSLHRPAMMRAWAQG